MIASIKCLPLLLSFGLVAVLNPQALAQTFSIENVRVHDQPRLLTEGILGNDGFVPQTEVEVKVNQDALSANLVAKAYYFDGSGTLIQSYLAPSVADRQISDALSNRRSYDWPTTLPQDKTEKIYFPLPDKLPDAWSVVVVFGNAKGAVAASFPTGQEATLKYPIVFKAEVGLGHADSPQADQLGIRFFEYALAVKAKRDAANAGDLTDSQSLDFSAFNNSPFYGDLMNQGMFPAHEKSMIPGGFLVPLPNRDIADAWNQ